MSEVETPGTCVGCGNPAVTAKDLVCCECAALLEREEAVGRRHRITVRQGAWRFFYVECSCGWRRSDGFAAESSAVGVGNRHVADQMPQIAP